MDIKQQTRNVAAQGRYGDNMLLHVNPVEMQGLASVMPLTKNPQTGQPEAFLPFLAPLLGSMAGTALFTGLSPAVAGALGSGIASTIQSGDLKQGIISGVTGFGLGKAFGAAGIGEAGRTAGEAATTAAETVANVSPEALTETLTRQAAATTPMLGNTPIDLSSAASGTTEAVAKGGLDAFASQLAKPSSYLPVAMGEGTIGTMQAQEDFERAMKEYELNKEKREEELYAMYPEQIPMSSPYYYGKQGGVIGMQEGGEVSDEEKSVSFLPGKGRLRRPPVDRLQPPPPPPVGSFEAAMSGGLDAYYTPPVQLSAPVTAEAVPVIDPMTGMPMLDAEGNPIPSGQFKPSANYRPGIDPEFNYLPGGNRSASSLTGLGNYLGQMGTNLGGTNPYSPYIAAEILDSPIGERFMSRMEPNRFNFDEREFGPSMFDNIDLSLNQDAINNYSVRNNTMREPITNLIERPYMPPIRDDFMSIDRIGNFDEPMLMDRTDIADKKSIREALAESMESPTKTPVMPLEMPLEMPPMREVPQEDFGFGPGIRRSEDFFRPEELMMPPMAPPVPPMAPPVPPLEDIGFGPGIRRSEDFFRPEEMMPPVPPMIPKSLFNQHRTQPVMQAPQAPRTGGIPVTGGGPLGSGILPIANLPTGPVAPPTNIGMQIPNTSIGGINAIPQPTPQLSNPFLELPPLDMRDDFMSIDRLNNSPFRMEAGGMTPSPDEIQKVQMAILGQIENNEQVIDMFVEKYGNEMFMMIREQILNPEGNAQTQGMIEGMGSGMDDQVLGMIGSQQPVAVSPGEYIVPADVVSGLGDGSSDAGAKELDGLLDRVRQERTNTTKQPKELNKGKVLPK